MALREPLAQLVEQHLVIGEDDVLLAAELAEEGAPRDTGRLRDLLHRGRLEALALEQLERRGDDVGARGGRGRCLAHVETSLDLGPARRPLPSGTARRDR